MSTIYDNIDNFIIQASEDRSLAKLGRINRHRKVNLTRTEKI